MTTKSIKNEQKQNRMDQRRVKRISLFDAGELEEKKELQKLKILFSRRVRAITKKEEELKKDRSMKKELKKLADKKAPIQKKARQANQQLKDIKKKEKNKAA